MINLAKAYYLTLLVSTGILVLLLIPFGTFPVVDVKVMPTDKLVHLCIFMIWMLSFQYESKKRLSFINILLVAVSFALSTEVLQLATKDRTFDLADVLYDSVGIMIGIVVWKVIRKFKTQI